MFRLGINSQSFPFAFTNRQGFNINSDEKTMPIRLAHTTLDFVLTPAECRRSPGITCCQPRRHERWNGCGGLHDVASTRYRRLSFRAVCVNRIGMEKTSDRSCNVFQSQT
jgi:hypothetical protein